MPASVYFGELFTSALTMVFYYVAAYGGEERSLRFYKLFIAAVLFIGGLGIVLYLSAPKFYIE